MAKRKDTKREALLDKLANLKHKQRKCVNEMGIARYGRLIHDLERQLADMDKAAAS